MLPDRSPGAQPPADLVQLAEAATRLHVNRATVWRWCLRGKLRSWRAGHRYLVSLADVKALLQPTRVRERARITSRAEARRQQEAEREWVQKVLREHGLA